MKSYWSGMLDKGATTFWEEYKPGEPEELQYGMYGDKFGKSLCHAWDASPIYLIGRYCVGLKATKAAYETFEIAPQLSLFEDFDCELPVKGGTVKIGYHKGVLNIYADKDGGVLKLDDKRYALQKGKQLSVELKK